MLLSLGMYADEEQPRATQRLTTFEASDASEQTASDSEEQAPQPDPEQQQATPAPQATATPRLEMVPLPRPLVTPAPIDPPVAQEPPLPQPDPEQDNRPRAVIRPDRNYGPPDAGRRAASDSEIVGTAPDGSPLYAARWFREPTRQEMAGYLSTVEAPAWALIACKTAPRWEVVDCVPIEQYPPRSNIMNAVLAATWQFQVRPPRRGNESLVGSWVRIRISYARGGPQASY